MADHTCISDEHQESREHNFALKQVSGCTAGLKLQKDNYFTDPECPQSLLDSFDFALDALNLLLEDMRRFNQHCLLRRHQANKTTARKSRARIINVR